MSEQLLKSDFYFDLPQELIAQDPLPDRSSSRMLVINKKTGELEHRHFTDVTEYLKPGDCLVINDTKVIPARIIGEKIHDVSAPGMTGARIELLLLKRREGDVWETLVKPGKRAKTGTKISFGNGRLVGEIIDVVDEGNRLVRFSYKGIFEEVLDELGSMPLPPYITHELKDKNRYQTVYAKYEGSAAAPTAGLHFTNELLEKVQSMGVKIAHVTLHVGLGTFRPVKEENVLNHHMHTEHYILRKEDADIINETKAKGGRVICVGTTSTRTVESCAVSVETDAEKESVNGLSAKTGNNAGTKDEMLCKNASVTSGGMGRKQEIKEYVKAGEGDTSIFIYPGYEFKVLDGLITNFHLPESTLIMLVAALCGRENILHAYEVAVQEKYRFFSFGDCCLIL